MLHVEFGDTYWYSILSIQCNEKKCYWHHYSARSQLFTYLDIDECATRTHSCSVDAVCNNTKGLHNCKCKPGYFGDGLTCTGSAMQYGITSRATWMLAFCLDEQYFERKFFLYDVKRIDRWFSYLDFDECVTRTHNCSTYAVCNNTKGSHNCKCKPGYSGNGQICKGDFSCVLVVLVHVFLIKPARSYW